MSSVNIKRAVDNIRSNTTPYTAIVEVVVNAIQAIDDVKKEQGKVFIKVCRLPQLDINGLSEITGFEITDNGIGFNEKNRESFDTLYSDHKIKDGGKGFGRFVCLKYFENLSVKSVFEDNENYKVRSFDMGKHNDIIVNEHITDTNTKETGTSIFLKGFKKGRFPDVKLETISRRILEKILPYFLSNSYTCPQIIISEEDGAKTITLNEYLSNELKKVVQEIEYSDNMFLFENKDNACEFTTRVFKFYSPGKQKSKISLVAHKREVIETPLSSYIPEFHDEFYDKKSENNRNYIIKAYVFGKYLDENVSLERGGFEFPRDKIDMLHGISQVEIETEAADIAKNAMGDEISVRQEKKRKRVQDYIDNEAPWHRGLLKAIDLSHMPYNPSPEEIEEALQKEKYKREVEGRSKVRSLLEDNNIENIKKNAAKIVSQVTEGGKNDLIHYISYRREILNVFRKSLEINSDGRYSSEGMVHDIIFPRRGDSEQTPFEEHNLWIIDERLNFTHYLASDVPLNGGKSERPDLLSYDHRVSFRGDNEASNPVTIFEFKKPQRDDFVNLSSKEDPVRQIIRYANDIKEGKFKTPKGREILVAENTPFYGYVVCDLTKKVKKWLETEQDFKPLPDSLGYLKWHSNLNLYIEVLSWDKVLKDADMKNKTFFHKLGIL